MKKNCLVDEELGIGLNAVTLPIRYSVSTLLRDAIMAKIEKEEIEENMKLEISPKPDTCIRVMMVWKGLNKAISVPEQVLEKQERSGYTAVEWGGTEVK